MTSIDNNGNITICKGDTIEYPIFIDASKDIFHSIRFSLTYKDELYFYLFYPNYDKKDYLIKQKYDIRDQNIFGDILFRLSSEDTKDLLSGTYYYSLVLKRYLKEDRKIIETTLVPCRKFIVI